MDNLRLLKIYNARIGNNRKLHLHHGLEFLSDELRYLHWDGYPLRSMPSNFQAEKLVELNLAYSNVKQLWTGVQNLVSLKDINLSYSEHLTTFPDLSQAKNIERINFENCPHLLEVSSSIQFLDNLVDLNMKCCRSLMHLPIGNKLRSLKTINLSGCSNFRECPEFAENIRYLNLNETAIEELPKSIGNLGRLVTLNLKDCKHLRNLPESVQRLKSLLIIDLSGCSNITSLPDMSTYIRYLYLRGTAIEELPSSIGHLTKLCCLDLKNCKRLKNIPYDISKLASLENLILSGCSNITKFPDVSRNVKKLFLDETSIHKIPSSIEYLCKLEVLSLQQCLSFQILPSSICKLKSLQRLNLSGCSMFQTFPAVVEVMGSLRYLYLDGTAITRLPSPIENLKGLSCLEVRNCRNLSILPQMILGVMNIPDREANSLYLRKLYLTNCSLLDVHYSIGCLFLLEALDLSGNSFKYLPGTIRKLFQLQYLGLRSCQNLKSLPELPPQLTKLDAHNCISLSGSPFYSNGLEGNIFEFFFTDCCNLSFTAMHNIMNHALTKFLRYAKKLHNQMPSVLAGESSFCIHGYRIPRWFGHQNEGFSTTMRLPSQWANIKFMGFNLCVVIKFNNYMGNNGFQVRCRYHFKNEDGECSDLHSYFGGWYGERTLCTYHDKKFGRQYPMFFGYDPCVDATKDDHFSKYRELVLEFYPEDMDGNPLHCCKVMNCGVRLLYSEEELFCRCRSIGLQKEELDKIAFYNWTLNFHVRYRLGCLRPFECFDVGDEEDIATLASKKHIVYGLPRRSTGIRP